MYLTVENVSNDSNPPVPKDPPAAPPGPEVKEVTEYGVFFHNPEISHTRTVWSTEAETARSSFGWNLADIT
jgi:hypothetical protein